MMRRPDDQQTFAEFNVKMRSKAGLGDDWDDPVVAMAHYDELLDEVQRTVPADRLVLWQASQGWAPLCQALDMPIPEADFPHLNTVEEFRDRADLK